MSEETPETATPDIATFDFDKWAKTGDAGRSSVEHTIYNDLTLLHKAQDIAQRIAEVEALDEEVGADLALGEQSELSALADEQAELEKQIAASKMVVKLTALSEGDKDQLQAKHKLADRAELGKWGSGPQGTFHILAHAARITNAPEGAQQLTAEQWEQVSEMVAGGQWRTLTQKLNDVQVQRPVADSPFSRSSSRLSKAVTRK